MSDHLPIYQITEYSYKTNNNLAYSKSRVVNEETVGALVIKRYKNKLTAIMRYCEKEYYTDMLVVNKGNIKETWKILNTYTCT